jgi:radical SAM-linked protein
VKLRVRYSKLGKIRFLGHRDTARLWERALRKAELPVAMSGGFTPRPKLSFGLALPTGAESLGEYLDIDLVDGGGADELDLADVEVRLSAALPIGFDVAAVVTRAGGGRSLQDDVVACTWELRDPALDRDRIGEAVERVLGSASLPLERERKGERRVDDIRPAIESLRLHDDEPALVAGLFTNGRAVRPVELAAVAFPDLEAVVVRVLRTHQWLEHDGSRREVIPLPTTHATPIGVPGGISR